MTQPFDDPERPPEERARALLDACTSGRLGRGALKRLAQRIDADPALRDAVLREGRRRGAELPEDAVDWPGKRLLRHALSRQDQARVRTNPIHRDEAFTCGHCGRDVPPHGRTARDHCPWCLRSLHVDVVPGDRASDCGGLLDPVSLELRSGVPVIRYRCRRCGAAGVNRALVDGDVPDDPDALVGLSAGEPP